MPLVTDDEIAVIHDAVTPSDVDIREAEHSILGVLEDGNVTRLTDFLTRV